MRVALVLARSPRDPSTRMALLTSDLTRGPRLTTAVTSLCANAMSVHGTSAGKSLRMDERVDLNVLNSATLVEVRPTDSAAVIFATIDSA